MAGIVISRRKVIDELKRGDDELTRWVKALPTFCFPAETEREFAIYQGLCAWAGSRQYKASAVEQFCAEEYADPWICAKTKSMGLTLVTQEVSEPESRKNVKLPDACLSIGVPCINKYELLRRLRGRFVLDNGHSFDC